MPASRDSWPFYLPADNPDGNPHPVESISRKPYYTAKMTLSGDSLITARCIFGGWICKTVAWTKSR
jgi:hypothetical protein